MSFQGFRSQAASFLNAQARRITGKSGDTEARSLPGAHGARQSARSSCREPHDRREQETSQGQDGNPEALIGHSG
jgi:hypothetical protein